MIGWTNEEDVEGAAEDCGTTNSDFYELLIS